MDDLKKDIGGLDTRLTILERTFARWESENSIKLSEIVKNQEKSNEKLNKILEESMFVKGFIKAVLFAGSGLAVTITVIIKFMH